MNHTKSLSGVTIKDATKGEVEAVFSTFGVIDKDGDVTSKKTFTDGAPVIISAYGHGSWKGELPVGRGVIVVEEDQAVMKGRFFMDTTHGRDTFLTVKQLSEDDPLQEWSYSLRNTVAEKGQLDGTRANFLLSTDVKEVSPVLLGASVDTRTLSTKGARKESESTIRRALHEAGRERWADDDTYVWLDDWDVDDSFAVYEVCPSDEAAVLLRVEFTRTDDGVELAAEEIEVQRTISYAPKGAKFAEQTKAVLTGLDALITRATEVVTLRAAQEKQCPSVTELASELERRVKGFTDRLAELTAADNPPPAAADVEREFLRFVAQAQGVTIS